MTSTNLPLQLTTFIGRERDLAELERLLSTARLVTLTGVDGSGKTRLAIQVARRVGENFPDGVFFVDLVPLREPELVPQLVLETLGLRIAPDQPRATWHHRRKDLPAVRPGFTGRQESGRRGSGQPGYTKLLAF